MPVFASIIPNSRPIPTASLCNHGKGELIAVPSEVRQKVRTDTRGVTYTWDPNSDTALGVRAVGCRQSPVATARQEALWRGHLLVQSLGGSIVGAGGKEKA